MVRTRWRTSRAAAFRVTLVVLILLLARTEAAEAMTRRPASQPRGPRTGMRRILAGDYLPLYRRAGEPRVHVASFYLQQAPVTRGDYLAFVQTHEAWRRDRISRLYAEPSYLADWPGALDAGDVTALQRPVTSVSWFAATAYCESRGQRLPTVDEWEYAAAASATERNAANNPAFMQHVLMLYATRSLAHPEVRAESANVYGILGLHTHGWEWTSDFNSVLVSADAREAGSGVRQNDHRAFCASAAIGATDPTNYPAFLRYAVRAALSGRAATRALGFRCAADLPSH